SKRLVELSHQLGAELRGNCRRKTVAVPEMSVHDRLRHPTLCGDQLHAHRWPLTPDRPHRRLEQLGPTNSAACRPVHRGAVTIPRALHVTDGNVTDGNSQQVWMALPIDAHR